MCLRQGYSRAPEPSGGTWSPRKKFQPKTVMLNITEHFPINEGRKRKNTSDFAIGFAIYTIQLIQIWGRQCRLPGPDYVELSSQPAL